MSSKDSDFVEMILRLGKPPQLLWITCGNVTNRRLQDLLSKVFVKAQKLLISGEEVVEITDS
jgi:predicted nuclease of predicted toxin-antitoxin system